MRRPMTVIALAAASALLIAGCSSSEPGSEDPTASSGGNALCAAAAPAGDASNAVKVSGDFAKKPEVTIGDLPVVAELQRTVVTKGTGAAIGENDFVEIAMTLYDADSKKSVGQIGYDGKNALLPQAASDLAQMLGCAEIGSRIVFAFPASQQGPAGIYVLDVLGIAPTKAWGESQKPQDGMPVVTLDDSGKPSIKIPDTDAPKGVKIDTLKKGDGETVGEGDEVLVQYLGVKWSDNEEFDSSWKRNKAASFNTRRVVAGFTKALEGQPVGSQVLVVMDPENGYGEQKGHELEKETLVFVVDILATQHPEEAAK